MVGKRIMIIEMVEGVLLVMRDAEEGGKGVRDEEVRDIVVTQCSLSSSNPQATCSRPWAIQFRNHSNWCLSFVTNLSYFDMRKVFPFSKSPTVLCSETRDQVFGT